MSDDPLLAALAEAERANPNNRLCQACDALAAMSPERHAAVQAALGGTIGQNKLAKILSDAGFTVGRRAIGTHRREDHQ